jgi:hypothetical protein
MAEIFSMEGTDVINLVESVAGVKLTEEQKKNLTNELKNSVTKDPAQAVKDIASTVEKIAKLSLSSTQLESLGTGLKSSADARAQAKTRKSKWEVLHEEAERAEKTSVKIPGTPTKNNQAELISKKIETPKTLLSKDSLEIIVNKAGEKLKLPLNDAQKKSAMDFINNNLKPGESPVEKANIALLGVISAYFTTGLKSIVLVDRGNAYGIIDYNPQHGLSTLDQPNRADFTFGDPLGVEFRSILNCLHAGNLNIDTIKRIENENGVTFPGELTKTAQAASSNEQNAPTETSTGTSKSSAPKLSPFASTSTNPYDQ